MTYRHSYSLQMLDDIATEIAYHPYITHLHDPLAGYGTGIVAIAQRCGLTCSGTSLDTRRTRHISLGAATDQGGYPGVGHPAWAVVTGQASLLNMSIVRCWREAKLAAVGIHRDSADPLHVSNLLDACGFKPSLIISANDTIVVGEPRG